MSSKSPTRVLNPDFSTPYIQTSSYFSSFSSLISSPLHTLLSCCCSPLHRVEICASLSSIAPSILQESPFISLPSPLPSLPLTLSPELPPSAFMSSSHTRSPSPAIRVCRCHSILRRPSRRAFDAHCDLWIWTCGRQILARLKTLPPSRQWLPISTLARARATTPESASETGKRGKEKRREGEERGRKEKGVFFFSKVE